jgi:C-terminal processing protease CtpA/Prc
MYLDLNRITNADFDAALSKICAGKGVIFDLRGYPNRISSSILAHLTDSTLTSARWGFPVIQRPDHQDTTYRWDDWQIEPKAPRIHAHAAFLVDVSAISAAETFLGIVEHYRLADLVGEPTAGTNGVVTSILLPGRYSIPFTGMRVLKQDGTRHHGVGILPTIPVSRTIEGVAAGRDEQLERAIEVVRQ